MTISLIILAIFFLFSSFAFGCTENWAVATCEVILFLGAGIVCYIDHEFLQWPKKLNIFAIFVAFLIAICVIQLIPLPISFWNIIDKSRIEMYEDGAKAEELLQSEKYRVDPFEKTEIPYESQRYTPKLPSFLTLTRTPLATIRGLIALLSFFCFILLLEDVMRQGNSELRRLALFVGLIGLGVGLIALIEKGIEHRTHILWIRESARAQYAFGPFVNANHGEAFINLTFPIIFYFLWRKIKRETKFSEKIGQLFLTLSVFLIQGFLVVSGFSYGNYLCILLIPIFLLFNLSFRLKSKIFFTALLAFFIILFVLGLYLVSQGAFEYETKKIIFHNAIYNLSFFGLGINSFQETFPSLVVSWPVIKPFKIEYLENEYLQLFYEAGFLPFALAVFLATNIIFLSARKILSKKSVFWICIPLISETVRVFFDMTFHIFPLAGVFCLLFAVFIQEK